MSETNEVEIDVDEQKEQGLSRITVVENVYHQVFGEDPTVVESHYDRLLETSEQVYTRRLQVTEEWKPLDVGWLSDVGVGLLVIQNREGSLGAAQVNPTKEEREDVTKRIVEVGNLRSGLDCHSLWLVYPGESMRGCPTEVGALNIRCQHGSAAVAIHAFPK